MFTYTFEGENLKRVIEHTRTCPIEKCTPTFSQMQDIDGLFTAKTEEEKAKARGWKDGKPIRNLLLVGDQGVYLMSNGNLRKNPDDPEDHNQVVCYAKECNPETQEFDDWWHNKRAGFGADDGSEVVDLPDPKREVVKCEIKMSSQEMTVTWVYEKAPSRNRWAQN